MADDESVSARIRNVTFSHPTSFGKWIGSTFDVLVDYVELGNSSQTANSYDHVQALSISIRMNIPKNVPDLTMITVPHFSLLPNMIWEKCLKILNDD